MTVYDNEHNLLHIQIPNNITANHNIMLRL